MACVCVFRVWCLLCAWVRPTHPMHFICISFLWALTCVAFYGNVQFIYVRWHSQGNDGDDDDYDDNVLQVPFPFHTFLRLPVLVLSDEKMRRWLVMRLQEPRIVDTSPAFCFLSAKQWTTTISQQACIWRRFHTTHTQWPPRCARVQCSTASHFFSFTSIVQKVSYHDIVWKKVVFMWFYSTFW